jgi:hypothetical protein
METLDLPLLPSLGAPASSAPLAWAVSRELHEADWLSPKGAKPIPLKALRASHHQLARLLAEGSSDAEISALLGYCPSRISILKRDPSVAELIAFYARRQDELSVDVSQRLKGLTIDTLEVLHERLLEAPEDIKTADLREVAEMGLDRIGLPKATRNVQVNVAMTAEELRELRESANSGSFIPRGEFLSLSVSNEEETSGGAAGGSTRDQADPSPRGDDSGPAEGEDL